MQAYKNHREKFLLEEKDGFTEFVECTDMHDESVTRWILLRPSANFTAYPCWSLSNLIHSSQTTNHEKAAFDTPLGASRLWRGCQVST